MKPTLYIVATPIGNLSDMSERVIETLKNADVVLCEDTRVTRKLLERVGSKGRAMAYHQHSHDGKMAEIVELLTQGNTMALVSDAGTPGISDPGGKLVEYVAKELPDAIISPIPGPSAVVAALSVSGFRADTYTFLGFPPHKTKRQKFFKELAEYNHTVVFYESCHRIHKALDNLAEVLSPETQVVVCRELTKLHETIYRGTVEELKGMEIKDKGEFVVVVG